MTVDTGKHVVVFPIRLWGHTRTMCTLAARLVKLRQDTVTFFTVPSVYDRVKVEIAREFLPDKELVSSRLRVIAVDEGKTIFSSEDQASFVTAWGKMLVGQPLVCAKTGIEFKPHPIVPSAVILDMLMCSAFDAVQMHRSRGIKVYVWYASAVVGMGRMIKAIQTCPNGRSNPDDVELDSAQIVELFNTTKGKLIEDPFCPPMYDYEYAPQAFPYTPGFIENVISRVPDILNRADGFVTFDAADYAPDAAKALRAYFGQTGRNVYYAGPLIPQGEEETSKDARFQKITRFLDEKLASHGEKSIIYISFGTIFWPMDHAKFWAVLSVIMERNIPFVLSSVAEWISNPPEDMKDQLAQYSHGIIADWVPQQALLEHPATGWYISHGGHNSTLETILAGIPTIVWPVSADQAPNAIHLSETLDVAFELIEVRHGTGAGSIYRTGRTPIGTIGAVKAEMRDILERAYGDEGARKRANLLCLRERLQTAWTADGVARREVEALLDAI